MPQISRPTDDGRLFHDMSDDDANPCVRCNACCRTVRVSFYQGELDTQPGGTVPAALTVPVTPFLVAMKGTETGLRPCIALGDDGRCTIYARRSSTCREFPAFLADGRPNPDCARLRAKMITETAPPGVW